MLKFSYIWVRIGAIRISETKPAIRISQNNFVAETGVHLFGWLDVGWDWLEGLTPFLLFIYIYMFFFQLLLLFCLIDRLVLTLEKNIHLNWKRAVEPCDIYNRL